jgi:hypothetical protein
MKKTIIVFLALSAAAAFAEDEQLIGDQVESGGFGGPVWRLAQLNGETAAMSGGRGGWVINHTFVLGGGGYGTDSDVKTTLLGQGGKPLYLGMSCGGLEIEYINRSRRLVHWTVRSLFGGGELRLNERNTSNETITDGFGIVDADFNAEINVVKWMRVNAGAGYRLVFGVETAGLGNSDIGGAFGQVTLKFGKF